MKTIKINNYKMDKIADRMGDRFGKIKIGNESKYTFELFTMETNLMKIHRKNPECKSRRVIEAANILLLKIEEYLSKGIEYDFSGQLTEENKIYLEALQIACDPFYNQEIKELLEHEALYDLNNMEDLENYFTIPVKCLIRIKESVELWVEHRGINGYFKFLEQQIGSQIKDDDLDFIIRVEDEKLPEEIKEKMENDITKQ